MSKKTTESLGRQVPLLKKVWDEYGHSIPWDQLYDYKYAVTHEYVVVCWKDDDGKIGMADLSFNGTSWEMQNDGFEEITESEWKKLQIVPYCDWFVIPGSSVYTGF